MIVGSNGKLGTTVRSAQLQHMVVAAHPGKMDMEVMLHGGGGGGIGCARRLISFCIAKVRGGG